VPETYSQALARLNSIQERDAEDPNSATGVVSRIQLERRRTGVTNSRVNLLDRQRDDVGIFGQFARGAVLGAVEPFAFLRPVGSVVESLESAVPDSGAETVARVAGNLAGFFVPLTPAMKIGGTAAKALRLTRNPTAILEIADAGANITRLSAKGRFVQGAVAGAAVTAGAPAEDPAERLVNTALAASVFGIGDAILPVVGKAIWGMMPTGRTVKALDRATTELVENGSIVDESSAAILGRAAAAADALFPKRALDDIGIAAQREAIQNGTARMFSSDLIPGHVRVVPGLPREAGISMDKVLGKAGGFDFAAVKPPVARGQSKTIDYLVFPKGEMRAEIVQQYEKQGFLKGQKVAIDGNDWTIIGYNSANKNVRLKYQDKTKTVSQADLLDRGILHPVASWTIPKVKDAPKLWTKYLDEVGIEPGKPFEAEFAKFIERHGVKPEQAEPLREYFTQRLVLDLARIAPEEWSILSAIKKKKFVVGEELEDPLGTLRAMAAQQGYSVHMGGPVNSGTVGKGVFELVNAFQPGASQKFPSVRAAMAWIRENPQPGIPRISDLVPGLPLPEEILFGYEGAATQVTRGAAGMGGMNHPKMNRLDRLFAPVTPRLSAIRNFANRLTEQSGGEFQGTKLWGALSDLQISLGKARNQMNPHVKTLEKIRGRTWNQNVRPEKMAAVNDLIEAPTKGFNFIMEDGRRIAPSLRDDIIKNNNLSAKEIKFADEMRQWWDTLFKEITPQARLTATSEEFLQVYAPIMRSMEHDAALKHLKTTLGSKFDQNLFDLLSKVDASGLTFANQVNPVTNAAHMLRGSMMHIWAGPQQVAANQEVNGVLAFFGRKWVGGRRGTEPATGKEIVAQVEELVKKGRQDIADRVAGAPGKEVQWDGSAYEQLFNMGKEYLSAVRGGAPETWYSVRIVADDFLKSTGVKLSEKDVDKLVNTVISLNYGAFMGYRPALAVRNMIQPFVTTYPMVGAKYLAHGLKMAGNKDNYKQLRRAGAVVSNAHAPFTEEVWMSDLANIARTSGTKRGAVVEAGAKALESARALSAASLSGRGAFYTRADTWNRAVSFFAQRKKTLDAWNKYKKHGDVDVFNQESGLDFLGGQSMTQKFWDLVENGNPKSLETALDWSGTMMANETQWIYQSGAGPSLISQGIWKMAGQYGTWPAWYIEHFRRGLTRGLFYGKGGARQQFKNPDRIKFALRTGALHGAIVSSAAATGMAMYRWSPLASMSFSGGPMVEFGKDITALIGGKLTTGGSTAERMLVLGKYGARDTGHGVTGVDMFDVLPFTEFLPFTPGSGIDIKGVEGWMKLFTNGPGKLIPGSLLLNDFRKASEQPDGFSFALRAAGFPIRAQGSEWGALKF